MKLLDENLENKEALKKFLIVSVGLYGKEVARFVLGTILGEGQSCDSNSYDLFGNECKDNDDGSFDEKQKLGILETD